jgi:hypothetical protein
MQTVTNIFKMKKLIALIIISTKQKTAEIKKILQNY